MPEPSDRRLSDMRAPLQIWKAANRLARRCLSGESAPFPTAPPGTPGAFPDLALRPEGRPLDEVLRAMGDVMDATPSSSNPRFLNQLFGGRIPVAVAADVCALMANTSMYTFKAAGAQVLVENEVLRRMTALAGFIDGEGTFTPGGSMANLLAMLLARNTRFPEARDQGLAPGRAVAYTSAEAHYSIRKNAGILGLGRASVRFVATGPDGTMDPAALDANVERDLADGRVPFFVNATAGTTVRGAFDPLPAIGDVAARHGLWFHVDGALGAALLLSPGRRALLAGVERADSLAWNPHKMMGVALQTSVLLLRKRGLLAANLDETADYLFQAHSDDFNPGHRSLQCGRRNDAFRLWAAWAHLGDEGWARRLDRQLDLARHAAERIASDPALELVEPPPSIDVCFSVRGADSRSICDRLDREGRLKIGYGEINGRNAIRLVCVNPDLPPEWIDRVLDEIKRAAFEPDPARP
jgi:glutamate/tyrosine decarboxylase-like PLP-dependent enzyme